jgi:hypothetical protein
LAAQREHIEDEMDKAWWALSDDERALLNSDEEPADLSYSSGVVCPAGGHVPSALQGIVAGGSTAWGAQRCDICGRAGVPVDGFMRLTLHERADGCAAAPDLVERVARAIYAAAGQPVDWHCKDDDMETVRESWRQQARAAIDALKGGWA